MAIATQANLEAAEKAYQALMTGQSVVKFRDQNGEEVTYTSIKAADLLAYIRYLRSVLGVVPTAGPLRPWFV